MELFLLKTVKLIRGDIVKSYIALFLLIVLFAINGCTNANDSNETLVQSGHELRPSEPVTASMGDVYLPQSFGWKVTEGRESLVEFTVLSIARIDGVPQGWAGDYHYSFVLHISDVLLDGYAWSWPSKDDEVSIIGFASIILEEGQNYLAFINPHSLDGRVIAIINNDRSISATVSLGNYFIQYDGFSVEQMMEIANEYLATGYTPEWWDNTGTCIIDGLGEFEAPVPVPPDFNFIEPGSSIVIEGLDGTEILHEAWNLDLDGIETIDEVWDLDLD